MDPRYLKRHTKNGSLHLITKKPTLQQPDENILRELFINRDWQAPIFRRDLPEKSSGDRMREQMIKTLNPSLLSAGVRNGLAVRGHVPQGIEDHFADLSLDIQGLGGGFAMPPPPYGPWSDSNRLC